MNNHQESQEIQKKTALLQLQITEKLLKQQNKDWLDKLSIFANIVTPVIIALFGYFITTNLNEREIKISEAQTVAEFKDLLSEATTRKTAILSISSLDNKNLAIDIVRIDPSPEGIEALAHIGRYTSCEEIKFKIIKALLEIANQDINFKENIQTAIQNMMPNEQLVIHKNLNGKFEIKTQNLANSNFNKKTTELFNSWTQKVATSTTTTTTPTTTGTTGTSPPPPTSVSQDWAIVIGADSNVEQAKWEVQEAKNTNIWKSLKDKEMKIFKRGGWFRTVITNFTTKEDAEKNLDEIQKQIRGSSYIINLQSWCPPGNRTEPNDYTECKAKIEGNKN